jgi:hypothetical protein
VSSVCSVVTEECQQARNKCEVCKRGGGGRGRGRGAIWEVRGVQADSVQAETDMRGKRRIQKGQAGNRRNGRGR